MNNEEPGFLLVLTGPTASGKDTVAAELLKRYPQMSKIVTTTTRSPRNGEQNGIHHNFVSTDDFLKMQHEGKLLEWVEYSGNLYGTSRDAFNPLLGGHNILWRNDVSRAANMEEFIRQSFDPETAEKILKKLLIVYIKPENKEDLHERLAKREDQEDTIKIRMAKDEIEWEKYHDKFQNVVINKNGELDKTVEEVSKLINNYH